MNYAAFYKKIYFDSLTPTEILKFRVKNNYISDVSTTEDNSSIEALKHSLGRNHAEDTLSKYCRLNNFTDSDIVLMTTKIGEYENEITFPTWLECFKEVSKNISVLDTHDEEKPFYQLLFPFIDYFSCKILSYINSNSLLFLEKEGLHQIKLALYNDLFEISQLVLIEEFSYFKKTCEFIDNTSQEEDFLYKKFIFSNLENKYRKLALKYPMLFRKILVKTHGYIGFVSELFERLESDREEIESRFKIKIQKIEKIYMNLGDQHNSGSTVIIEFENSNKVVYKPSNVGITNAYNNFIKWVNIALNEALATFEVIDRKNYGWLQFVEYKNCDSKADIKLYYERAGILLGVAYFLNASDFHFENVIASGNSPVFIDHESIISPRLKLIYNNTREGVNNYVGTVLETSLLPVKNFSLPYYIYGYGSSSMELESRITTLKITNPDTDSMTLAPVIEIKSNIKLNKPTYKGKIENLMHYKTEFNKGFERIYNLILNKKNYLLSENSPINNFYDQKIRFVNRPTRVYYKILKSLNSPAYLTDAVKYGMKLEVLARAYMGSNKYALMLGAEREQMLLDDIPVFYITTTDKNVNLIAGRSENLIALSAIENIHDKIKKASVEDYKIQMALIEDSIEL